jgi:transcriptional regulator
MHPNPAFRRTADQDNVTFARQRGFGVQKVNGPDGPLAPHIPFQIADDVQTLDMHLARSIPIARAGLPAPALIAISDPDADITPDGYGVPDQVPTWNDVAVHLRGIPLSTRARLIIP